MQRTQNSIAGQAPASQRNTSSIQAAKWLLIFLAMLGVSCAQGQAPDNLTYSGPLVITQGGTYTGNYRSTDSGTPAVRINTTQAVVLQNCVLVGPGELINATLTGVDLTVRECKGYGLTPTADNVQRGYFLNMYKGKSLVFEHNYLESNRGVMCDRWVGDGSSSQTLRVRYNKARNLIGNTRNDAQNGLSNFILLNTVVGVANMEIAWNQIENLPGQSKVEDNINFYNSGGTASSPARVHDNFVFGAYPIPVTNSDYNGTGFTTDGDGSTPSTTAAYIELAYNQFVSTCNAGINIAAGHDINVHDNRIVTSGYTSDGANTRLTKVYCGMSIFNWYNKPAGTFGNFTVQNNTVGYTSWGQNSPYTNRYDFNLALATVNSGNVSLPAPVTTATEANEVTLWQQKLQQNSIVPGPTGSTTPTLTTPATGTTTPSTPTTSTPTTPTLATPTTGTGTTTPATGTMAFYRAFNINGAATTIDGNSWEAGTALQTAGGYNFANQSVALSPATDASRASMIRSSTFGNNVRLTVPSLPSGSYQVYLYVWEDNYSETFSVLVNGQTVASNYSSGAAGHWDKLGPYAVTRTGGSLVVSTSGGTANCSGLEIWRAGAAATTPVTTTPVATTPTTTTPTTGGDTGSGVSAPTFYRAINLNGSATSIDGNAWEGSTAPNYSIAGSFSLNSPSAALSPATDANRAAMLRSCQYSNYINFRLTSVPAGTYQVYAYVWEDSAPETYSVTLNGQTVATNLSTGAAGTWKKIGPYTATVGTDGLLNLRTTGGTVNLSGVEVWKQASTPLASLYPNPLGAGQTQVQLSATFTQAQQVVVSVLSQMGTVLQQATLSFPAGTSSQPLNVGNLAEGTYIVRFLSGSLVGTTINLVRQN